MVGDSLRRKRVLSLKSPSGVSTQTYQLAGEVPAQKNLPKDVVNGLQIINSPYPTDRLLTNTAFRAKSKGGIVEGNDKIFEFTSSNGFNTVSFARFANQWCDQWFALEVGQEHLYKRANASTIATNVKPYAFP